MSGLLTDAAFWHATPLLVDDIAWATVGREAVVWSDGGAFWVPPVGAAILPHLDGRVSLRELADDLAHAGQFSQETADAVTAKFVVELVERRALPEEEFAFSAPLMAPGSVAVGIDESHAPAVVSSWTEQTNGTPTLVEVLADGSTRYSTTVNVSATAFAQLVPERSPAELVPIDSCLGSKLRIGPGVNLVSIDLGGEIGVRSVYCHDDAVLELLVDRVADRLVVMPWEVVDAGHWWVAADRGVASVMVVGVEPGCKCSAAFVF